MEYGSRASTAPSLRNTVMTSRSPIDRPAKRSRKYARRSVPTIHAGEAAIGIGQPPADRQALVAAAQARRRLRYMPTSSASRWTRKKSRSAKLVSGGAMEAGRSGPGRRCPAPGWCPGTRPRRNDRTGSDAASASPARPRPARATVRSRPAGQVVDVERCGRWRRPAVSQIARRDIGRVPGAAPVDPQQGRRGRRCPPRPARPRCTRRGARSRGASRRRSFAAAEGPDSYPVKQQPDNAGPCAAAQTAAAYGVNTP